MSSFLTFLKDGGWVPFAALVVGAIVRLLKSDTPLPTLPAKWRPLLAVGLGVVSGVLAKVAAGLDWKSALLGGLGAASLAMFGHDFVVEGLRNGKEPLAKDVPAGPMLALLFIGCLGYASSGCAGWWQKHGAEVLDDGSKACVLLNAILPNDQIRTVCRLYGDAVVIEKEIEALAATPRAQVRAAEAVGFREGMTAASRVGVCREVKP